MNVVEKLDLLANLNKYVTDLCEVVVHQEDRWGNRLWVAPEFEYAPMTGDFTPSIVIQDYDEQRVAIPLHRVNDVIAALQTVAADPHWQALMAEAQAKLEAAK